MAYSSQPHDAWEGRQLADLGRAAATESQEEVLSRILNNPYLSTQRDPAAWARVRLPDWKRVRPATVMRATLVIVAASVVLLWLAFGLMPILSLIYTEDEPFDIGQRPVDLRLTTATLAPANVTSAGTAAAAAAVSRGCPYWFKKAINGDLDRWREGEHDGSLTAAGILLLLRAAKGAAKELKDTELFFECPPGPSSKSAPTPASEKLPVLRFSRKRKSGGILFPDPTFWGWDDVAIPAWGSQPGSAAGGAWADKDPLAVWVGQAEVKGGGGNSDEKVRKQLGKCALDPGSGLRSDNTWRAPQKVKRDDGADDLAPLCRYRYRVYAGGHLDASLLKHSLACGSTVLQVAHADETFFSRGLKEAKHFLKIERDDICKHLKKATAAASSKEKDGKDAANIAKAGSAFAATDLAPSNVYSYMWLLLDAYSKLLKYAPARAPGAEEVTEESLRSISSSLSSSSSSSSSSTSLSSVGRSGSSLSGGADGGMAGAADVRLCAMQA
eukprot:jgi/Mesen1/5403/ME000268S04596